MQMPARLQRKQIIVERGIQFRFARFVIIFAVGTALVTSCAGFLMTFAALGERLAGVYPQGRLIATFQGVYLRFGILLLITIPIIFYLSIRFSHRFVGPLPKIYETLRKVGEGDFNQNVGLRPKDELRELASAINSMIKNLKSRYGESRKPPKK